MSSKVESLNQQFFRKEAREIVWYWVAATACMLFCIYIALLDPARQKVGEFNMLFFALFWFAGYTLVNALATFPFSSEFGNNTMARLLAQPVRRVDIWNRKILLLGAALSGLLALEFLLVLVFRVFNIRTGNPSLYQMLVGMVAFAFFTGPLMALFLRQGLTALLASIVAPLVLLAPVGLLINYLCSELFHFDPAASGFRIWNIPVLWWLLCIAWCVSCHLYARHRFLRLEV